MSFVERIKVTDGTEVASVNASNQLEVAEANSAAIKTAVEIIDNAISGNEMQVDVVAPLPAGTNNIGDVDVLSVPAPLNLTGGGTETGALRVTLANNSTGVLSVDDNGSSLTVDGTVAATQSGTWNITNVSGTVSLPTGAATAANQSTIITAVQLLDDVVATDGSAALTKLYQVGGTDGTNAQILSTNASGHLNIADGNNSITVDGTVAATQSGTWILGANSGVDIGDVTINNASIAVTGTFWQATQPVSIAAAVAVTDNNGSLTVDAPVGTPVFVRLSDGASAISTLPVSLASVPSHPVTNAGTFAVQAAQSGTWNITNVSGTVSLPTGASTSANQSTIITALQLLDDTVVTDNAGFTDGTTKLSMSGFIFDEVAGTALTENDAAAARIDAKRAQIGIIEDGATRGRYATVTAANALKVDGSAVTQPVSGTVSITANSSVNLSQFGGTNVVNGGTAGTQAIGGIQAHDAAVSNNNPILIAGVGSAATPSQVSADGDVTRLWLTRAGAANVHNPSFDSLGGAVGQDGLGLASNHLVIGASDGQDNKTVACDPYGALLIGGGSIPHDSFDSGSPIKIGAKAIEHGANPTAVAAADRTDLYANRHGILWTIGGHPNLQSAEYITTGAQTNDNILPAIATGSRYVITGITVTASAANSVNTSVRIGFGTASVPAQGASGADAVTKVILSHPNIAAGSGVSKGHAGGIVGIGGDDEELRITCSAPTGGSLVVQVDYYTIES